MCNIAFQAMLKTKLNIFVTFFTHGSVYVSSCRSHLPLTVMITFALLADPMELLATHL